MITVVMYYIAKIAAISSFLFFSLDHLRSPQVIFYPLTLDCLLEAVSSWVLYKANKSSHIEVSKWVFIWSFIRVVGGITYALLAEFPHLIPGYIKLALLVGVIFPALILEPIFTGRCKGESSQAYARDSLKINVQVLRLFVGVSSFLASIKLAFDESMPWTTVLLPAIYTSLVFFFLGMVLCFTFIFKLLGGICSSFVDFKNGRKAKSY